MLNLVLRELHNWFPLPDGIYPDEYTVEDGSITLSFLQDGQYFRIVGSVFNDGVYQYPATDLTDETFYGAIWALAIPQDVITLAEEIEAWDEENGTSPYTSESFGGYSYSRATDEDGAITWQSAFKRRLDAWRKI